MSQPAVHSRTIDQEAMMRFVKAGALAWLVLVGMPGAAWAQDPMPKPELGVGVTGLSTYQYEDFLASDIPMPAVTGRVTIPVTPRFSFDTSVDVSRRASEQFSRTDVFYLLQVKQRLQSTTRGSFHAFLTYGIGGYYQRFHQKEVHATLPNGQPTVTPDFIRTEWEGPAMTLIGGGVQYGLAKRLAFRAEAQMVSFIVIPLGVRVTGSLSIPLG
jgi:hypothetical protein